MINSSQHISSIIGPIQSHSLAPSSAQNMNPSILRMIHDLSVQTNQQKVEVSSLEMETLPVYQLISQLHQHLSMIPELVPEFSPILEALKTFLGPQKEIVETASKTSSSTSSLLTRSKSLLESLERALASCRHKKDYTSEYLIRKLFANLICLNPAASKEEVRRALELEQEHLDCVHLFKNLERNDQEKYDEHLENYLNLLSTFFDFDLPTGTLKGTLCNTVEALENCLIHENRLPLSEALLLRQTLVFLHTRAEWFTLQSLAKAKCLLMEGQERAGKDPSRNKLELQLILLEANEATKYQGISCRKILIDLLARLTALLQTALSPSDKIIALSIGVSLYEGIAKEEEKEAEKRVASVMSTLHAILIEADQSIQQLNFTALLALAKCRFLFGFYSCLCFQKKEEFEKGLNTLLALSQDFWADEQTKQASARLRECLDSVKNEVKRDPINKQRCLTMKQLQFMLFDKVYDFSSLYVYTYQKNERLLLNREMEEKSLTKTEQNIWDICKQTFTCFFSNTDVETKKVDFLFQSYFYFYCARAKKNPFYGNLLIRTNLPDLLSDPNLDSHKGAEVKLFLDKKLVAEGIDQAKNIPLLGLVFNQDKLKILDGQVSLRLDVSPTPGNSFSLDYPALEYYSDLFQEIFYHLMKKAGRLDCVNMIQEWIHAYVLVISISSSIRDMFSKSLNHLDQEKRRDITRLRNHASSLSASSNICLSAYLSADYLLPDYTFKTYTSLTHEFLFNGAYLSPLIGEKMSHSKEEKYEWCQIRSIIAEQRYLRSLAGRAPADVVNTDYIHFLSIRASLISLTQNPEKKLDLLNTIFGDFPDTWEKMQARFMKPGWAISNDTSIALCFLIFLKAKHLFFHGQWETGFSLLDNMLHSNASISSKKQLNKILVQFSKGQLEIDLSVHSSIVDIKKLKKESRYQQINKQANRWIDRIAKRERKRLSDNVEKELEKGEQTSQHPPISENVEQELETREQQSEQKDIRENAKQMLERSELKKKIKEARRASSVPIGTTTLTTTSTTTSTIPFTFTTSSISTNSATMSVAPTPKTLINHTAEAIFDRLWQEKNATNAPWELRSFRNDVTITRKEALTLILALGGHYSARRGRGSHLLAYVPTIQFNGKDMGGLINLETNGELMITLTNSEDLVLTWYQIKQLRNILIQQGFTPDRVAGKEV